MFLHGSFKIYYNSLYIKIEENTSGDLGEGYNVELKKNRFTANNIIR